VVYPVVSNLPVTLNGAPVGVRYLQGGMPIVLFLNSRNVVDQVQVRPAAGGR